jgi:steroid delta-isomerase-like uncharacterized protein
MSIEENTKVDDEFMASWNARDADRTMAVMADGAVWYDVGSPEPMRDRAAMRAYVQSWYTGFPDMVARTVNRVVSDDQVAVEVSFSGTNTGPLQMGPAPMPPTGKKVDGKGTYFARIRNGKITEVHTYPDVAGMMMQLGMMPGS